MRKTAAKFTVLGFCLVGTPLVAASADYHLLHLDGKVVKWGDAEFQKPAVVRYSFAKDVHTEPDARNCKNISSVEPLAESTGVSTREIQREAALAFAAWQEAAGIKFLKVDEPDEADILIGTQTEPHGYAFTNVQPRAFDGDTVAKAKGTDRAINLLEPRSANKPHQEPSDIAPIAKALICFNPEKRWKIGVGGDSDAYDLRYTFMHEIGHAIGLDHVGKRGFLMNFRYTEAFRVPQPGDIAGAERLYGPPQKR